MIPSYVKYLLAFSGLVCAFQLSHALSHDTLDYLKSIKLAKRSVADPSTVQPQVAIVVSEDEDEASVPRKIAHKNAALPTDLNLDSLLVEQDDSNVGQIVIKQEEPVPDPSPAVANETDDSTVSPKVEKLDLDRVAAMLMANETETPAEPKLLVQSNGQLDWLAVTTEESAETDSVSTQASTEVENVETEEEKASTVLPDDVSVATAKLI